MNKKIIYLFCIFPLLNSCSYSGCHQLYKNGDLLYSQDNYFVCLNSINEIETLFKSNDSFIIYYGLTGCSNCEKVKNNLIDYINKEKQLIYYIENQKFDLNQLNIYDHYFDIANLYLFDDGKLIKTIKSDNLNNVTMIKNNLKNYFNNSSTYVFNNSNNYIDYLNNNYGISYLINRNDDETLTKYNNLKNNFEQNKNTIIFYLNNINNDDVLYSYLNINDNFIKITFDHGNIGYHLN